MIKNNINNFYYKNKLKFLIFSFIFLLFFNRKNDSIIIVNNNDFFIKNENIIINNNINNYYYNKNYLYKLENNDIKIIFKKNSDIENIYLKKFKEHPYSNKCLSINKSLNSIFSFHFKDLNTSIVNISKKNITFRKNNLNGSICDITYRLDSNLYILKIKIKFIKKIINNINVNIYNFNYITNKYKIYKNLLKINFYDNNLLKSTKIIPFESKYNIFKNLNINKKIFYSNKINWLNLENNYFTNILLFNKPTNIIFNNKHLNNLNYLNSKIFFNNNFLDIDYYYGPKSYNLLKKIGKKQEKIFNFGIFTIINKIILNIIYFINKIFLNWGITIILTTILIKLILWPINRKQIQFSKKMSEIQKELYFVKQKYVNNYDTLQKETIKIFKNNKINPIFGFIATIIQIPIFISFYFILKILFDLKLSSFLWIKDLSLSDTIGFINIFPINILPFIMGISMFLQLYTNYINPVNKKDDNNNFEFIKIIPVIFLIFGYNLPSSIILYWTVQNIITIIQQLINY